MNLADITAHYNFPTGDGAGHTIAFIELGGGFHQADMDAAFHGLAPSPTIVSHSVTSSHQGLPITGHNAPLHVDRIGAILDALEAPGATIARVSADFHADAEWSTFLATFETTLDLQIAGSIANAATLDAYFAPQSTDGLRAALRVATQASPTVISISWGLSESAWDNDAHDLQAIDAELADAREAGIAVCCASGDHGSANGAPGAGGTARVNFPASSPHVLAVGGTALGAGGSLPDVVWNTSVFGEQRASGGGESRAFARPEYQSKISVGAQSGGRDGSGGFSGRLVPDVAALADRATGYPIVLGGRPFLADGTSAATPLWAALLAVISQRAGRRVGWVNDRLYAGAGRGCTDVVTGDNKVPGVSAFFSAGSGWDACTGWGTPDGLEIERLLLGDDGLENPPG